MAKKLFFFEENEVPKNRARLSCRPPSADMWDFGFLLFLLHLQGNGGRNTVGLTLTLMASWTPPGPLPLMCGNGLWDPLWRVTQSHIPAVPNLFVLFLCCCVLFVVFPDLFCICTIFPCSGHQNITFWSSFAQFSPTFCCIFFFAAVHIVLPPPFPTGRRWLAFARGDGGVVRAAG